MGAAPATGAVPTTGAPPATGTVPAAGCPAVFRLLDPSSSELEELEEEPALPCLLRVPSLTDLRASVAKIQNHDGDRQRVSAMTVCAQENTRALSAEGGVKEVFHNLLGQLRHLHLLVLLHVTERKEAKDDQMTCTGKGEGVAFQPEQPQRSSFNAVWKDPTIMGGHAVDHVDRLPHSNSPVALSTSRTVGAGRGLLVLWALARLELLSDGLHDGRFGSGFGGWCQVWYREESMR